MNYLDVYFSRINHLGETTAERIRGAGVRSFEKWLAESPHTVRNLSVERGYYFDGIILTSKDKEYEKIMFLEVANDILIKVGDIMNWTLDDGTVEKWLLIQEEKKVNGTFKSFWIVRCNYLMRWIDSEGHLKQSWGYFVSSLDSKIKGNFRTWNDLITPQPNKYAELLLPRYSIDRATNFIVEEESWTVVEYDHTSVPGVVYLSLTESKINSIYDDVKHQIADLDKLAKYKIDIPAHVQTFAVGTEIKINFTLMKNDIVSDEEIEFVSNNKNIAKLIDGKLMAIAEGQVEIILQLKDHPEIKTSLMINVVNGATGFSAYIEGNNTIKLDRIAEYHLKATEELIGEITFSLDTNEYASIIKIEGNKCVVRANAKNKLGSCILQATHNGIIYTKEISIIPLWQVSI